MAPSPPRSANNPGLKPIVAPGVSVDGKRDVEIIVIPDKYYAAALKLKVPELIEREAQPPKPTPPPKPKPPAVIVPKKDRSRLWMIAGIAAVVAFVVGGFVLFNRDLLFRKPAPPPAPIIKPPAAPSNLTATTTGSNGAALNWINAAGGNENGYRIERRDPQGNYVPLTNLPPNSTAFLDVSAQAGHSYNYRVFAMGQAGDSPASNEASITVASAVMPPPPPPLAPNLPPDGLDADSDGLTDAEEALWGTNPHKADTGGQGFLDGNAVFNLYSPTSKSPATLLDAHSVAVSRSPAGWSIWVPTKWSLTFDQADGSQATINTGQAETFVIRVEDNPQHQSLTAWVLARTSSTAATLPAIRTKGAATITTPPSRRGFGLDGLFGPDHLTAYFAWGDKILSVSYQLNGQAFVYFRTTFGMMLNSLTLAATPTTGAMAPVIPAASSSTPSVPSATSTRR